MVQACDSSGPNQSSTEAVTLEQITEKDSENTSELIEPENKVPSFGPDDMKLSPEEMNEQVSGYYKSLFDDGTLRRVEPYCKGKTHGTGIMFYENGALDSYAEFDKGVMTLSIDLTRKGILVNFFDGEERVISSEKLQNRSPFMDEKIKFIREKCPRNDQADWDAVLNLLPCD